jgi:geranylgeranyl reductase family protein
MAPTHIEFDAVIVGAGPAGATAARDLAHAGARVAIVDDSHPREKPCGGGVTGRALEILDLDPASLPSRTIDDVTFSAIASGAKSAQGRDARVPLNGRAILRVYARERFDAVIVASAVRAGAVHLQARAAGLERERGTWRVRTTMGDLAAHWIVGADGAASVVRKRVFRPFERAHLSIAAGSYVEGAESSSIVIGFTDTPRGYLWSFPRPGHLAVGACAQADEASPAALHAITDRWIDRYPAAQGRSRRRYAWPIPSLDARAINRERPSGDGWMLAGDAAGLVDPITREGIFFALRSGQLAAAALAGRDPARRYAEAVRDELHDELRRAAILKAGFFRPRFIHLLLDALDDSAAIRSVMIDLIAGRQPYRGLKRRLIGTMEIGWMLRAITAPCSRRAS